MQRLSHLGKQNFDTGGLARNRDLEGDLSEVEPLDNDRSRITDMAAPAEAEVGLLVPLAVDATSGDDRRAMAEFGVAISTTFPLSRRDTGVEVDVTLAPLW